MARRHPIVRGLLILMGVCVGIVVVGAGAALLAGGRLGAGLGWGRTVGVLELRGVIADATDAIDALERFRQHEGTVAVVLRVESPGGAVAPAQEIYDEVWRVRAQKPVIASLGNVAASGGYYVAAAANVVVADPGTVTGSIGAIMSLPYYGPLADKLGVSERVVKSGPFKDTGHPLRPMSPEERAVLQETIDDVYGQFVEAVARGRGMEPERVRALADGRIYSGAQARKLGLVDVLGGLEDATRLAWERAGQSGEPHVVRLEAHRRAWWLDLLGSLVVPDSPLGSGGVLLLYPGRPIE